MPAVACDRQWLKRRYSSVMPIHLLRPTGFDDHARCLATAALRHWRWRVNFPRCRLSSGRHSSPRSDRYTCMCDR